MKPHLNPPVPSSVPVVPLSIRPGVGGGSRGGGGKERTRGNGRGDGHLCLRHGAHTSAKNSSISENSSLTSILQLVNDLQVFWYNQLKITCQKTIVRKSNLVHNYNRKVRDLCLGLMILWPSF
jgi:hypothetical protein